MSFTDLLTHALPYAVGALAGGSIGAWLALRGKAPPKGDKLR